MYIIYSKTTQYYRLNNLYYRPIYYSNVFYRVQYTQIITSDGYIDTYLNESDKYKL